MATKMKHKFELYYGDFKKKTNIMVLVAIILDSQYKLRFVKFALRQLYPYDSGKVDGIFDNVSIVLRHMYDFYVKTHPKDVNVHETCSSNDVIVTSDVFATKNKHYNMFFEEEGNELCGEKSKLEKYLDTPHLKIDGAFDILNWWKERDHEKNFSILTSMAKSILGCNS